MAGLEVPGSVEGNSLLPALEGSSAPIRDTLHFAHKGVQRAVRRGSHKLIEYAVNGKRKTQLFDLANDPHETKNLADEPGQAETLASLWEELRRSQTELGDTQEMGTRFSSAY